MTSLKHPHHVPRALALTAGAAVAASLSLFAQAPNGSATAGSPAGAAAVEAQGRAGGQGAGRGAAPAGGREGRGGGRAGQDNMGADFSPKDPILAQTPEEQAQDFLLPAGYRMELVAADPDIIMPAVIEWDGNGRMYVSEFRTYMLDGDATGEHEPESRISRWEDTNGDGTYDHHTVFLDDVLFPRMILPLDDDSILINETHSDDVVRYWDTNKDGVADRKEVFFSGVGRGRDGNVEHEQSGFIWALDNWIYSTYNSFRFRWTPDGVLREPTGPNGGSWGLTQDDDGKPWFVNAGGERGPVNFQFPIHYGAFAVEDGFEPDFQVVWPAPSIGDMQGGMRRIRQPIGALNHFTATTGPDIVRGHRLPEDLQGDLLFTEPVGRLIRRAEIVKTEGLTQLRNVYPGSEFILSTDPLFRPVNIKTAPDGTVYVADMYHGIIQEAQWVPRGSYVRAKIEQYQLDKVISHGRIWRLRYDGTPPSPPSVNTPVPGTPAIPLDLTQPRMLDETPAQLVAHLGHPNGWWRDMAQRLLILEQDRSVVPTLETMVRTSNNLLERFHALWTLEGLGALDAEIVRAQMKDAEPRMRVQALRASETLYKAGNRSLADDYRTAAADPDPDVAIQAMLTMDVLKVPQADTTIQSVMALNQARGVQEVGRFLLAPEPSRGPAGGGEWLPEEEAAMERGGAVYTELCFECHGEDGRGTPLAGAPPGVTMAPALAGNPRVQGHREYVIKVLLHGMTGPVAGKTYTQVMIPMGAQTDDWIADVGSYVRNSFGNSGTFISPEDVARVRAATSDRTSTWTEAELLASMPEMLEVQPTWNVTASHNPAAADDGLTLRGWTSEAPQEPGMWYQVELPQAVRLTEVQFDAAGGGRLGRTGRNGGGPETLGFARGFRIETSLDGQTWNEVASGPGSPLTTVPFAPVEARFVRITQTAAAPGLPPWVIQNLRLYERP